MDGRSVSQSVSQSVSLLVNVYTIQRSAEDTFGICAEWIPTHIITLIIIFSNNNYTVKYLLFSIAKS
jgi:hypothetical protein